MRFEQVHIYKFRNGKRINASNLRGLAGSDALGVREAKMGTGQVR